MLLGDQKPMLVKKQTSQQQLLAILKDRSAPPKSKGPPFALQRQTEATALCKQMAASTGFEARERVAVLKSFADDTSGSMANVFLGMDLE